MSKYASNLEQAIDQVVSAEYTATIGATSILPTAFTATLPDDLMRIMLIPQTTGVYIDLGATASSADMLLPLAGIELPVTKATADLIQIYASNVVCTLLVLVPRP